MLLVFDHELDEPIEIAPDALDRICGLAGVARGASELLDLRVGVVQGYGRGLYQQRDPELLQLTSYPGRVGRDDQISSLQTKLAEYWEAFDPLFAWTPSEKIIRSATFLRREVVPRREAVLSIAQGIEELNNANLAAQSAEVAELYSLGFGDPVPVSALHGRGSGELLDRMVTLLHTEPQGEPEVEGEVQFSIIGRPNAGKSSIANKLLGEERYVVHPEAGTTRDAVDSTLRYHGKLLRFIDTAGLRRRARVQDDVEFYSTLRTERAIDRADVCILVVDATRGLHNQDLRIATEAWEKGAGLVIAVNKWDLVAEKDPNTAKRGEEQLKAKAPFLQYVPFVYVSALTGQRVRKLLDLVLEVAEARHRRVSTAEVNRVLEELVQRRQPPQKMGEEVRLLYGSQIGTAPPAFAIVSNRPEDIPESYQRYLVHGFRNAWAFTGSPLRLKLRARRSGGRTAGRQDGRVAKGRIRRG